MSRAFSLAAAFSAAALTASAGRLPVAGAGDDSRAPAVVTLAWEHRGIPEGMKVHEPGPGAADLELWHTASAKRFEGIPAGAELAGGKVSLRPGESRRLLLVYHNPGKTAVKFFASPHHVHPDESSLGFEFACLCMNHVYTVPPGGWWWRVVELKLEKDFAAAALEVKHVLLAPALKPTLAR